MSLTPKQNWSKYRLFVESKQIENERSRSAVEIQRRYAKIIDHVRSAKGNGSGFSSALAGIENCGSSAWCINAKAD